MAAYAALVSLMNNIDNIHNHPHLSTSFDKNQIDSLGEKLDFFLDFVETCNSYGGISKEKADDLERLITSSVHAAEDVIESHIVNQILAAYSGEIPPSYLDDTVIHWLPKIMFIIKKTMLKVTEKCRLLTVKLNLCRITKQMDIIMKKVMEFKAESRHKDQQMESSMADQDSASTGKTTVVGLNTNLYQLLDWLTGQQPDRQVIPITGMGGIGKTTLARNAYESSLIVQHFDVCAWVAVSQEFNKKKILSDILCCLIDQSTDGLETEEKLGEKLHKFLSGRRYLIVLDDIWSTDDWDKMKIFFPDNSNRSRIVVTTRICNVGNYFGSLGLALNLLDDDQSWTLFCEKVFGQDDCPPELERTAKRIVEKCRGLPLSIVVIAGLLRKSSWTEEYWEYVAKDLSSILSSGEGNQCLSIFSLSYNHLPACLKPCFLYLGMFAEDQEIWVYDLIKLWVAEGFIKTKKDQTLEEVAEGFVKDLIDRNLISARRLGLTGKVKTCVLHDLLRDLCVMMGAKEKFFSLRRDLSNPRRIGLPKSSDHVYRVHPFGVEVYMDSSLARSLISAYQCAFHSDSRLLRVLYNVYSDPDTICQLVNLRFLSSYPISRDIKHYKLPSSISLLRNLQTLIIPNRGMHVDAPSEIWEMRYLRHFKCNVICLPSPPRSNEQDATVTHNLQTLKTVSNFRFSEEACKRMANIKKLQVVCREIGSSDYYYLYNVASLGKLESLKFCIGCLPSPSHLLQHLKFPSSLKKLVLGNCGLLWTELTVIGSLPHLEVLVLGRNSVRGPEWNSVEGDFLCLKILAMHTCDALESWNADSSHFPVLERLEILYGKRLDEIPSSIGDIPTLQSIKVGHCSFSVAISAIRILEEQEGLGNHGLEVGVAYQNESILGKFRVKVAEEGFTSLNFQLAVNAAV